MPTFTISILDLWIKHANDRYFVENKIKYGYETKRRTSIDIESDRMNMFRNNQ